jgi:hypothetical protein
MSILLCNLTGEEKYRQLVQLLTKKPKPFLRQRIPFYSPKTLCPEILLIDSEWNF